MKTIRAVATELRAELERIALTAGWLLTFLQKYWRTCGGYHGYVDPRTGQQTPDTVRVGPETEARLKQQVHALVAQDVLARLKDDP